MRLNWFSPLPPAKSGIADYTACLLPSLQAQAEIILWTDQDDWDANLENVAEVRRYHLQHMPWAELNRADMSVYHLGNNPRFHAAIWQVSFRQPGVVVLHDLYLHHFFAGVYLDQLGDRVTYAKQLERYYGHVGRQDAEAFWDGYPSIDYMAEHYPLTPLAVEHSLGALVHTTEGQDLLRREARFPVLYAPLPYAASPHPPMSQWLVRGLGTREQPCRLIVFGYLDRNRRLDILLRAIAAFPESERFRIDIYGELWDNSAVHTQIRDLGLENLITVHGFVTGEELDAALAKAHLAVNLRLPTMGEASLSQLRIWDHALPALVTRVGWYASLPEDTVSFVRPEHEVLDIQAHLRGFLDKPQRFREMGERGRSFLEDYHTPQAYAEAVVELAAAARRFGPHAIAEDLVGRVGAELGTWTGSPIPQLVARFGEQQRATHVPQGDAGELEMAIQGIRQVVAEQIETLRRQRAEALQGIRQTVTEHIKLLQKPVVGNERTSL